MADKKYTDEEIIKALDICTQQNSSIPCCDCPCWNDDEQECEVIDDNVILDIINRQKVEIERLKKEVSVARDAYISIQDRYEHAKTEAYKAFAENAVIRLTDNYHSEYAHWIDDTIYSLLKEIAGEEE